MLSKNCEWITNSTESIIVKAIDKLLAQSKEVLSRKTEVKTALKKLSSLTKKSIDFNIEDTEEGLVLDLESGDAKQVVVDGDVIKGEGEGSEEGMPEGDEFGGENTHEDKFDFENIDGGEGKEEEPEEVIDIEKRMKHLKSKFDATKDVKVKETLKGEFNVLASKRKRILSAKK